MRTNYLSTCILCLATLLYTGIAAQSPLPPTQWAYHYGGSSVDIPFVIKFTSDGGTIVGGYTDSKDGDIDAHTPREYWDLWVAKLDRCGTIQWEQSFGGTGYESARDIVQTSDGGYMVLGRNQFNRRRRNSRVWRNKRYLVIKIRCGGKPCLAKTLRWNWPRYR